MRSADEDDDSMDQFKPEITLVRNLGRHVMDKWAVKEGRLGDAQVLGGGKLAVNVFKPSLLNILGSFLYHFTQSGGKGLHFKFRETRVKGQGISPGSSTGSRESSSSIEQGVERTFRVTYRDAAAKADGSHEEQR